MCGPQAQEIVEPRPWRQHTVSDEPPAAVLQNSRRMIAVVCDDRLCRLRGKPVGDSVTEFFLGAQDNDIALLMVGAGTSLVGQPIGCVRARDREG